MQKIGVAAIDYLGYFGPQILFFVAIYLLIKWPLYLAFYLIGFATNVLVNITLKGFFKQPRPSEDRKIFNISVNNGKRFGWDVYGMPSGHSQGVGFSTAFIFCVTQNPYLLFGFILISVNTIVQRIRYKNHTAMQTVIGFSLGLCWGILFYMLGKKFIRGKMNKKEDDNAFFQF
uniref:Phosphatidic acid phosphatase type 2/haloperoxidase domain-containing protein n=1 Tax=viral metagenome TaxID=1070528 RepID=A0A6C0F7F1_9ZZZZ